MIQKFIDRATPDKARMLASHAIIFCCPCCLMCGIAIMVMGNQIYNASAGAYALGCFNFVIGLVILVASLRILKLTRK